MKLKTAIETLQKSGLSRASFARMAEVSQGSLRQWELGQVSPSLRNARKIVRVLNELPTRLGITRLLTLEDVFPPTRGRRR